MLLVVAALLKKEAKYLVVRRAPHMKNSGEWEFPGGKIEKDESPEQALERELLEELSIITKTGNSLIASSFDYGHLKIKLLAYESSFISGEIKLIDHDKMAWLKPKEMKSIGMSKADLPIIDYLISADM